MKYSKFIKSKALSLVSLFVFLFQLVFPSLVVLATPSAVSAAVGYDLEGQKMDGTWTDGNLGGGYAEGDTVPAKLTIKDIPAGTYSLIVESDHIGSNGAIGYDHVVLPLPGYPHVNASGVTIADYGTPGAEKQYEISFTVDSAGTDVVLYYGNVLGLTASEFPGSSLHLRVAVGVYGESMGAQSVPISVNKIEKLAGITLTKLLEPTPGVQDPAVPADWCFNVSPMVNGQSDYCITGDGDGVDTVFIDNVPDGAYFVTEYGPEGYDFVDVSGIACTNLGDGVAEVAVEAGNPPSSAECLYTNAPSVGGLSVVKRVSGPNGEDIYDDYHSFEIVLTGIDSTTFYLSDDMMEEFTNLPVGMYTVEEINIHSDYYLHAYSQDADGDPSNGAQIMVVSGQSPRIEIENRQVGGEIEIEKFLIDSQGEPVMDSTAVFQIQVDGVDHYLLPGQPDRVLSVPEGVHTIEEVNLPLGYEFVGYSEDLDGDPSNGAQIEVMNNGSYIVGITNQMIPSEVMGAKYDNVDPVLAGEGFEYTIEYTNMGPHSLDDSIISDVLPFPLELFSAVVTSPVNPLSAPSLDSPTGGPSPIPLGMCMTDMLSNSFECNVGDIPAGMTATVLVNVIVPYWANTMTVVNEAYLYSYDYPDGLPVTESTDIERFYELTVEKETSSSQVVAGGMEDFYYTVLVRNEGPSGISNVQFVDDVPDAFVLGSVSPVESDTSDPIYCDTTGNHIDCDLGEMIPGDWVKFQIIVSVPLDTDEGIYNNIAVVTTPDGEWTDDVDVQVLEVVDMMLNKMASEPVVSAGESFIYSIMVDNGVEGMSDADHVVLTDLLPVEFIPISGPDNPACNLLGNSLECYWDHMSPADPPEVINIEVMVPADVEAGMIPNTAYLSYDEGEPLEDTAEVEIVETASLRLEKVDDVDPVIAGGPGFMYTITVYNDGPSDADNVEISDTLPPEFTLDMIGGQAAGCNVNPSDFVCQMGDIEPGGSRYINVYGYVESDVNPTVMLNYAEADSDETEVPVVATEETTVLEDVVLDIHKTAIAPDPVIAGDTAVLYQLDYENFGVSVADNVFIVDELPDEFDFISVNDGRCTYEPVEHDVNCVMGALQPGETGSIDIMVNVGPSVETGEYWNLSEIYYGDDKHDESSASVDVIEINNAVISKQVTSDSTIVAGDGTVSFGISLINHGPSDAENVVITDDLSELIDELEVHGYTTADVNLSISASKGTVSAVDPTTKEFTVDVGDMAVMEEVIVQISMDIPAMYDGGMYTNRVWVEMDDSCEPPVLDDVQAFACFECPMPQPVCRLYDEATFQVIEISELEIDKSADVATIVAGADPEGYVEYTIVVTNHGPSDAENTVMWDVLPAELEYISNDSSCTYIAMDHELRCDIGHMMVDDMYTVKVLMYAGSEVEAGMVLNEAFTIADHCMRPHDEPGEWERVVDVTLIGDEGSFVAQAMPQFEVSDELERMYCAMDDEWTEVIEEVDLVVEKTSELDQVNLGEEFTYEIRVVNNGPSDTENVGMMDTVPGAFELLDVVADTGICAYENNDFKCKLGDLAVGEEALVVVTVRVREDAEPGMYENIAYVHSDEVEEVEDNEIDEVLGVPELTIWKDNTAFNGPALAPGDTVTYMLNLKLEEAPMPEVQMTDVIPQGLTYVPGTFSCNVPLAEEKLAKVLALMTSFSISNGLITVDLMDMEPGEVVTCTYDATIDEDTPTGLYKDLAFAQGTSVGGLEVLAEAVMGDPSYFAENVVGTSVPVEVPPVFVEEGVVLGTSTVNLPSTGPAAFVIIAAIVTLILSVFGLGFLNRKNEGGVGKKAVFLPFVIVMLMVSSTVVSAGTAPVVTLSEPADVITERAVTLSYAVVSSVEDSSVNCYYKAPGASNYMVFGAAKLFNSATGRSGPGTCVADSSIITMDGEYMFKIVNTSGCGDVESDVVSTVFDTDAPDIPDEYVKETYGTCSNRLRIIVAKDGQSAKLQIFRSTETSFEANESTLIDEISVTPGEVVTYDDPISNCDEDYYYLVRSVDGAGNVSEVLQDVIEEIVYVEEETQIIEEGTTANTDLPDGVTVNENGDYVDEDGNVVDENGEPVEDENGEVLGEEEENGEEADDEDTEEAEEDENGDEQGFLERYRFAILLVVAVGIVAYGIFRRRGQ